MRASVEKILPGRRYGAALLSALCISGVVPPARAQAVGKVALVIASDPYDSKSEPVCSAVGRDIAAALEGVGYDVVTVIDATSIAMRGAIQTFTGKLEGRNKLAFAYLCGPAAALGERIFLLPSETDPAAVYRLETQGVVVTAIVNAMIDAESTLLGDLSGVDNDDDGGARKSLRQRADTAGIQTIVSVRKESGEVAGRAFVESFRQSGSEWLATATLAEGLSQVSLPGTILSAGQINGDVSPDIATVPVPQARPLAVSASADVPKAKPAKTFARKKARATRRKQHTKPKGGLLEFFKSNRRIRE